MGMIIQNGKQYFPVYNDSEIKALPTVSTASGSVATFDTDMTENLVKCVCEVTNASQVNVGICGTNLFFYKIDNASITSIGDFENNSSNDVYIARVKENTQITFACNPSGVTVGGFFTDLPDLSSTTYNNARLYIGTNTPYTLTVPNGVKYLAIRYLKTFNEPMVNNGTSLYNFSPLGNNYIINLGNTYTGTVDVITGKIVDSNDDVYYASNTVEIPTINGTNNLFADTGDTSVKYILSVGKAIS